MHRMVKMRCRHCHESKEVPQSPNSFRTRLGLCFECWHAWLEVMVQQEEEAQRQDPPPPALPS